ncbi:XRE family transcriptional regulator [Streptosporangium sandarakinum]|uniref:XRE family transcriptional regulator n=1 Tax=Streptosporangium sandarakinum TaxID=1260955 RepID=UPI0033A2D26D
MHSNAFDPIEIPARVWEHDENREILKKRDVAGLFNLAVKYSGASQTRISAATGIAQGHVSMIINRRRLVTDLEVYERIATGFALPDHARMLFGLAPVDTASPTGDHGDGHQEQIEELTARLEAAAVIDPVMVMILTTETNNLRLMDRRVGGIAIADKMRAHITHVERVHRHAVRHGIRAQLAHVLAETASLAGWQAINTGVLLDAWDHYEHAKAAAREADNPAILAYVSGEQAYVLMDMGRPAEATELLQHIHATHRDRIPARLRTWLAAAEAEAAAILGDENTCRTALEAADTLLPEGSDDAGMPYLSLDIHHLARWRGNCLVRFGNPGTIEDLRSALAGMDGTYNRAEAGLRCDLGHALLAQGEPDAALPHIQRAEQLATLTGSRRQHLRIRELSRAVKHALH